MKVDNVYIAALDVHLPDPFPAEEAVAQGLYDPADYEENGLTATLIAGDISAPDMAVLAARKALTRFDVDPGTVDLLLHATVYHQGPEVWSPAAYIQQAVLHTPAPAIEVRQGCNGMLTAIELACCYLHSVPGRQAALLTAADNFASPVIDRWRSGPGFLAADAASAVLLSTRDGFARVRAVDAVTIPEMEGLHRGDEPLFPPGAIAGRKIDLRRRSSYFREHSMMLTDALEHITKVQGELINRVLAEAGIGLADIARIAYMNAARYIVEYWMTRPLGIPLSKSTWDFGRGIGHAGASDQIISLEHLLRTRQLQPGDHVLLAGVAPGLSVAAVVVEILEVPAPLTSQEAEQGDVAASAGGEGRR